MKKFVAFFMLSASAVAGSVEYAYDEEELGKVGEVFGYYKYTEYYAKECKARYPNLSDDADKVVALTKPWIDKVERYFLNPKTPEFVKGLYFDDKDSERTKNQVSNDFEYGNHNERNCKSFLAPILYYGFNDEVGGGIVL